MKNEQIIKDLIKSGEGELLELRAAASNETAARVVCSFLNGEGGQLLIGVDRTGEIVGVKNPEKTSQKLQEFLVGKIVPEAPVSVYLESYQEKEIISVKVWGGSNKPYVYDGSIYYRRGGATAKASSKEVSELIRNRQQAAIQWERQPALGVELDDLDVDEINATIEASAKNGRAKEARNDIMDFLSYYGLFSNGHFTNAAVILFAKNPGRFLPQSRVRVSFLPEGKTGSTFTDDRLLEGNLFKNFDAVQDFFYKHLEMRRKFSDTKWQRQDDLQYPLIALREGVLNALIHQDYSNVSGSTAVIIYPDRLEITNFGSLSLKPAELKKSHLSLPVNPDIAQIVFLRGYIEKIGRGTIKIIDACKKAGLKSPGWTTDSNTVKLTFLNDTKNYGVVDGIIDGVIDGVTEDVRGKLKQILMTLIETEGIRAVQLSERNNIPVSSLERYIKQLREAGLIEFIGSPKTGGYYLSELVQTKLSDG